MRFTAKLASCKTCATKNEIAQECKKGKKVVPAVSVFMGGKVFHSLILTDLRHVLNVKVDADVQRRLRAYFHLLLIVQFFTLRKSEV